MFDLNFRYLILRNKQIAISPDIILKCRSHRQSFVVLGTHRFDKLSSL